MAIEKKELETLLYLQEIIEVYEEIASIRMQAVKRSVLANRAFLEGLKRLAIEVKLSYKREVAKIRRKNKTGEVRKTNNKTVAIFLSANTGLYGDIVNKTFREFSDYINKHPEADIIIVGKIGKRMYDSLKKEKDAHYFELSDSFADKENIDKLLKFVVEFKDIIVFHGMFVDMLKQDPKMEVLSGDVTQDAMAKNIKLREYIFEPSLEEVVEYFEKEILSSLFKHAVHESSLSKYASRMISLDRATERINDKIAESRLSFQREKHRVQSRKQVATLASIYGRLKHA